MDMRRSLNNVATNRGGRCRAGCSSDGGFAIIHKTVKISVIVPMYNVAPFVADAVSSIRTAADHVKAAADIEVILVDDGSTDATFAAAVSAVAGDGRFRIVRTANGGEGSARNTGIEVADGDWLMFFDSDDVVSPTTFADVVRALEAYPDVDLVRCGTAVFNNGGTPEWSGSGSVRFLDISHELPDELCMFGVTEMAYRRKKFADLRFGAYCIGADLVYTSACFVRACGMAVVDRRNYGYRIRPDSAAHSVQTARKLMDSIGSTEEMFENFASGGKRIGRSLSRGRGNAWIEKLPSEIAGLSSSAEASQVWRKWAQSMRTAARMSFFTNWQKVVVRTIVWVRDSVFLVKLCASMLCVAPYRMKLMILRRRRRRA